MAAFTGDRVGCLPSQRHKRQNQSDREELALQSTQERGPGQASVFMDRDIRPSAAQPLNSQASLTMQTTILKNKRGSQAEREITNKDHSTIITKK